MRIISELKIIEHNPKALTVALVPFEGVQKCPTKVSSDIDAVLTDGLQHLHAVVGVVHRPGLVVTSERGSGGLDRPATLSDIDRWIAVAVADPVQHLAQAPGRTLQPL